MLAVVDRERDRKSRVRRAHSEAVASIGEIPPVQNRARRERCRLDLCKFLVTYFPWSTGLSPFSDDHKRVIARIEGCILRGGRFVNAIYRGAGKTTIAENTAIWAVLYGHRRFVPVFAGAGPYASRIIDSIKTELADNDLLAEDFPEAIHAIRALEGKSQRCHSQTYGGELTHISWTADRVVLPTIRMSAQLAKSLGVPIDAKGYTLNSGGILTADGITGSGARGPKHKRPDGTQQRPDFVILDDPQTDESAGSLLQIRKRLDIIRKGVLKMGGHKTDLAIVMNATVIEKDDLVDQLLDGNRNPAWQGDRIPMVRAWGPAHQTHWLTEYKRLRETYDSEKLDDQKRAHAAATTYYRKHKAEMDAGCEVSWKHCFSRERGEISAVQHAYNLLIDDGPEVFASECQQQPARREQEGIAILLNAKQVRARLNNLPRGMVPVWSTHLTAGIDVHKEILYWVAVAWGAGFTGAVVDYGTWPEQHRTYFRQDDARPGISDVIHEGGEEHKLKEALKSLTSRLLAKAWTKEGGGEAKIERCPIDSGYQADSVFEFCRASAFASVVIPAKGIGVTAKQLPWSEHKPVNGERRGPDWIYRAILKRAVRQLSIDSNSWSSMLARRLLTASGDAGAMTLFGADPESHALFADHCCAEYVTETHGRGRRLEEWTCRVGEDNHWWDCLKMAAVAASMGGVTLSGHQVSQGRERKRVEIPADRRVR